MNVSEAIEILREHNEWRRGGEGKPTNPKQLGEAIDLVIEKIEMDLI